MKKIVIGCFLLMAAFYLDSLYDHPTTAKTVSAVQSQPATYTQPFPSHFTDHITLSVVCGGKDVGYAVVLIDKKEGFLHGDQTITLHDPGTHNFTTWGSCSVTAQ